MKVSEKYIPIELKDDQENNYQLVFQCTYESYEYGADADGARGEWRTEMVHYELAYCYLNNHPLECIKVPLEIQQRAEKELG